MILLNRGDYMQFYFYNYNKKSNSTAIPPANNAVSKTVKLKAPTTEENPTIILEGIHNFNYAYAPSWSRYYYVTEHIILDNNRTELHLVTDVLATYRSEIYNFNTLILRQPTVDNSVIDDLLIPSLNETTYVQTTQTAFNSSGCFVLSVASSANVESNKGTPTAVNYVLTTSQFRDVCARLFDPVSYGTDEAIGTTMDIALQTICNPNQYILKATWFPFSTSELGTMTQPLKVGWIILSKGETDNYAVCPFQFKKLSVTVPPLISVSSGESWKKSADFTECKLYVPHVGVLDIPLTFADNTLTVEYMIDIYTGGCTVYVKSGNFVIATANGQVGYSMQINSMNYTFPEFNIGTALRMGISYFSSVKPETSISGTFLNPLNVFTGDPVTDAYVSQNKTYENLSETSDIKTGIQNALASALTPTPTSIGSTSSRGWCVYYPEIVSYTRYHAPINATAIHSVAGYATNRYTSIKNINQTGYYKFGYADFMATNSTPQERANIANILKGGFWYE